MPEIQIIQILCPTAPCCLRRSWTSLCANSSTILPLTTLPLRATRCGAGLGWHGSTCLRPLQLTSKLLYILASEGGRPPARFPAPLLPQYPAQNASPSACPLRAQFLLKLYAQRGSTVTDPTTGQKHHIDPQNLANQILQVIRLCRWACCRTCLPVWLHHIHSLIGR